MLEQLKGTRPWVRFLSVLGFIGTGLTGLGALGFLIAAAVGGFSGDGVVAVLAGALYLVIGGLYVLPTLHLHRYAGALGRIFSQGGVASLEEALRRQRSFWKVAAVLVIVGMGLAVLAIVVAVAVGIASALG